MNKHISVRKKYKSLHPADITCIYMHSELLIPVITYHDNEVSKVRFIFCE